MQEMTNGAADAVAIPEAAEKGLRGLAVAYAGANFEVRPGPAMKAGSRAMRRELSVSGIASVYQFWNVESGNVWYTAQGNGRKMTLDMAVQYMDRFMPVAVVGCQATPEGFSFRVVGAQRGDVLVAIQLTSDGKNLGTINEPVKNGLRAFRREPEAVRVAVVIRRGDDLVLKRMLYF